MIDTSNWKEFRVGDLFRIEPAKGKNQQELIEGDDVPYIAASKENNGFNRMVSVEGHEDWVSKGNCLQFVHIGDAAAGHVNYIPSDFIGMSGKSSCAYNDRLNEYNGLFIASIIVHTNNGKYSFKDSWTGSKVSNTIIKLPATSDGQPDWDYMESYMKAVMEESEKSLENLRKADDTKHLIDVSGWGEFKVGDLFDKLTLKCLKKDFNKAIDCSEEQTDEFSLPLTNAKHFNNGIQFYGRPNDWESAEMTIDIVSNGAIATGDVYAQPQRTGVLWDSYLLKCKYGITSELVLQYMACIIQRCIKQYFGWDDKCTWDKVKEQMIHLPITSTGEPDWQYMEDYMKNIMDKSEQIISDLQIGA